MVARRPSRLHCCVPFCNRTRRNTAYNEWICSVHWRMIPPMVKQSKFKADRHYRKNFGDNAFWVYPAGSPMRLAAVDAGRACHQAWEACKAAAINRAVGIG